MYFLVVLKDSKEKVVIPQKWISNLNLEIILNAGITFVRKAHTVFISKNHEDEPDFNLAINHSLDINRPGCYHAIIVKAFGNYYLECLECFVAVIIQVNLTYFNCSISKLESMADAIKNQSNTIHPNNGLRDEGLDDDDIDAIQAIIEEDTDDDDDDVIFIE